VSQKEMTRSTIRKKAKRKSEEGQAILEFALVFVFLVLVLFGIIDFARIFFAYATMSNAAREGARYGIIHPGSLSDPGLPGNPTDPDNQAIVAAAEARMVVIGGEPQVQIFYPANCNYSLCPIQVRVTSPMEVWTPIIPSLNLVAEAMMHIE
jgi:hypothetical protein